MDFQMIDFYVTSCFYLGAILSAAGTVAAFAWCFERICSFAYDRMKCGAAFVEFLRWRRKRDKIQEDDKIVSD
jgi:hypothetical protein